jgi:hypothetical protein
MLKKILIALLLVFVTANFSITAEAAGCKKCKEAAEKMAKNEKAKSCDKCKCKGDKKNCKCDKCKCKSKCDKCKCTKGNCKCANCPKCSGNKVAKCKKCIGSGKLPNKIVNPVKGKTTEEFLKDRD